MHSVCGGVEKFGTGIPKMLNACKAGGNPEPEYRIYEKSISLVLKPYVGKDDVLLFKESSKGSGIRRNAILDLIRSNPSITIPEIAII